MGEVVPAFSFHRAMIAAVVQIENMEASAELANRDIADPGIVALRRPVLYRLVNATWTRHLDHGICPPRRIDLGGAHAGRQNAGGGQIHIRQIMPRQVAIQVGVIDKHGPIHAVVV